MFWVGIYICKSADGFGTLFGTLLLLQVMNTRACRWNPSQRCCNNGNGIGINVLIIVESLLCTWVCVCVFSYMILVEAEAGADEGEKVVKKCVIWKFAWNEFWRIWHSFSFPIDHRMWIHTITSLTNLAHTSTSQTTNFCPTF